MAEKIRVMVVDDHPMVRRGTCSLLALEPDMEVVGQAADGEEALATVGTANPDVLLMDLSMPRMDGVQATRRLRTQQNPVGIVILSANGEEDLVIKALQAGANGYLLKTAPDALILEAVRLAAQGKPALLQPEVARAVLGGIRREADREAPPSEALSTREVDVLRQVARDLGNKQIATVLGISDRTIQQHLSNIYGKLQVTSRTGAVLKALQLGVLKLEDVKL